MPTNSKRSKYFESVYGAEVLVGNWFELRLAGQIDKKAIAPAITGKSDCCDYQTTYQGDFHRDKPFTPTDEMINGSMEHKLTAYANKFNNLNGHIRMFDGNQFLNNYVTTTDISYRIIPQLVRQQRKDAKLGAVPLKFDNYGIYGNATATGLRCWRAFEAKNEPRVDMSTMKTEYNPKPIKPFVRATKKQINENVIAMDPRIGFCTF